MQTRSETLNSIIYLIVAISMASSDQTDSQIKIGGKKKFSEAELKKKLTDIEYRVTQQKATEPYDYFIFLYWMRYK